MLSKGFEVELYTGKPTAEIVGLSDRIVKDLAGFVREPDTRNVEFTTPLCICMIKPCVTCCVLAFGCEPT